MEITKGGLVCNLLLALVAVSPAFSQSLTATPTSSHLGITKFSSTSTDDGKGAGCTGPSLSQTQSDVTALFSLATGVKVTQLTSSEDQSWNTYADLPTYSSPANVIVYNSGTNPARVAIANIDGTSARVISGSRQGTEVQVTIDGKYAYFQGQNPDNTGDIYAVALARSGSCQQIRLSQGRMRPVPPAGSLVLSNSSIDPASGKNVIAFSEANVLHRVLDDGTALGDLTLGDSENENVFHRMRLNPVFPNILCYKRDRPSPDPGGVAEPEIWVVNLNSPGTVYSVTGDIPTDHMSWSLDGTKLGYITGGQWYVANVLNSDGTFAQANGAFKLHLVGPSFSTGLSVNFCNLSPDGSVYVCVKGPSAIYLMSLDGSRVRPLANPGATGRIYNGIPKPQFLDMQHILFASDRTGTVQLYVITGFTTTFP
jgi:hypothetical protein